MATRRHYVSHHKRPALLPKEVEQTAPRQYVDRFGTEYDVIWNGQPGDPPLTRDYYTLETAST